MRKPEKPQLTLLQAIEPIVRCVINFKDQRQLLHEMFTFTVTNAPENEIDNYTAKRFSPFYLALCETLENLDTIEEIHIDNITTCMYQSVMCAED